MRCGWTLSICCQTTEILSEKFLTSDMATQKEVHERARRRSPVIEEKEQDKVNEVGSSKGGGGGF